MIEKTYSNELISVDSSIKWQAEGEGMSILMIFKFIYQGSILGIDIEKIIVSDDTIMHLDTIKGLNEDYTDRDDLYNKICSNYLASFKDINYMRDVLLAGRQTKEAIKNISTGVNWRNFSYSKTAGGNGGLMRTMCIGLAFHQTTSLLKLIEHAIMISSITHPNCISFIGSIINALFVCYGLRDMNLETWIFELMNLLESDIIDNIVEKIKPSYIDFFKEDKHIYIYIINIYRNII